ncbi:MAG: radical SAM protein [Microgenomates group bacterium]
MVKMALIYPNYSEILGTGEFRRFQIYAGGGKIPERPHVGMGYLSEALVRNGVNHEYFDMNNVIPTYQELKHQMKRYGPTVIGLTMVTPGYLLGYKLIKRIKKDFPKAKIIVGGPHVSMKLTEILDEAPEVDVGFISEAEQSLPEYLKNNCNPENVKGVVFRRGKKLIYNPAELELDVDKLGWPKYEKWDLSKYSDVSLYTSRGCPFRCVFCTIGKFNQSRFRPRSSASVVEEIKYWYGRGQRLFPVEDDNFCFDDKRVFDLCDALEQASFKGATFALGQGVRADKASRRLLKRMFGVGFKYATIAVEGGNNKVLRALRKGETIQRIKKTIKDACDIGYEVRLLFVVGARGETWKDVQDSLRIAEKYPVMYSRFNNLLPIPGTELYNWVEGEHLTFKSPEEYLNDYTMDCTEPWYETPELSAEERRRAIIESDKVNQRLFHRYLVRKLNVMGPLKYPLAYLGSRKITQVVVGRFPLLYKLALEIRKSIT